MIRIIGNQETIIDSLLISGSKFERILVEIDNLSCESDYDSETKNWDINWITKNEIVIDGSYKEYIEIAGKMIQEIERYYKFKKFILSKIGEIKNKEDFKVIEHQLIPDTYNLQASSQDSLAYVRAFVYVNPDQDEDKACETIMRIRKKYLLE